MADKNKLLLDGLQRIGENSRLFLGGNLQYSNFMMDIVSSRTSW
ncbi:hypothetical protein [Sulfuriflexus sp.]|nr:hypothetical protein [Sulfuriflexus sp.]MDT8403512.1 hypothetical protein [Sulfuriflexus sp.]